MWQDSVSEFQARPLESNAVPIDTVIVINGKADPMSGTHVYRGPEEEGDMLDPVLRTDWYQVWP